MKIIIRVIYISIISYYCWELWKQKQVRDLHAKSILKPSKTALLQDFKFESPSIQPSELQLKESSSKNLPLLISLPKTGIRFSLIPKGDFMMGSNSKEALRNSDERQAKKSISHNFYMSQFELTQEKWMQIMGTSFEARLKEKGLIDKGIGLQLPLYGLSWIEANELIRKLELLEGLPVGTLHLPTEAQWEYACRAGSHEAFSHGNYLSSKEANFNTEYPYGKDIEKTLMQKKVLTVGSYAPNKFGLYDMHGNVSEWCHDWYQAFLRPGKDKGGYQYGLEKVHRGGAWFNFAQYCRSAVRMSNNPHFASNAIGLRLAITVEN